jgi:hypothetical protein
MRLWSINPKYLDTKGILALWRESLLAKKVLEGNTKGYINHPQLIRFRDCPKPEPAINLFLYHVYNEAFSRGFNFEKTKFRVSDDSILIKCTSSQLKYEFEHLKKKLLARDRKKYDEISGVLIPEPNPIFNIVDGEIEKWEKINEGG